MRSVQSTLHSSLTFNKLQMPCLIHSNCSPSRQAKNGKIRAVTKPRPNRINILVRSERPTIPTMELQTEADKDTKILQLEVEVCPVNQRQKALAAEKEKSAFLEKRVLDLKQRVVDLVGFCVSSHLQSTHTEAEEEAITMQVASNGWLILALVNETYERVEEREGGVNETSWN